MDALSFYQTKLGYDGEPIYVPCREKTCLQGYANNQGEDQPAQNTCQSDQLLCYSLYGKHHIKTCY